VGLAERRLPHPLRQRRAPPPLSHPLPRDVRGKFTSAQSSDGRATTAAMVEW